MLFKWGNESRTQLDWAYTECPYALLLEVLLLEERGVETISNILQSISSKKKFVTNIAINDFGYLRGL